jgi:hypothetical protein
MNIKNFKIIFYLICLTYIADKLLYVSLNEISSKVRSGATIGKLNYYISIKDETGFLFLGNSRTNHHVKNKWISDSSFNMGIDGSSVNYFLSVLKLTKPDQNKIVYLQIDPNDLFNMAYDGSDIKYLNHFYNSNKFIKDEIIKYEGYNFFRTFFWSIDFNGKVLPIIKNFFNNSNYEKELGFEPLIVNAEQQKIFKKIISLSSEKVCDKNQIINQYFLNKLSEIINLSKIYGFKLKIYTPPLFHKQCVNHSKFLNDFLKNKGIIYQNYSDLFIDNNDLKLWKDDIHLSLLGAEKFTKFLKSNL